MKVPYMKLVCLFVGGILVGCADRAAEPEAPEPPEPEAAAMAEERTWSYEGDTGPEAWGQLDEAYSTCATGQAQSPIDIDPQAAEQASLPALVLDYGAASLEVTDTGHGYKATPSTTHTLSIGDDTYQLLQFHMHTPSEHTLAGASFPMGVHFVHQNEAGQLAVVGVMVETGEENASFAPIVTATLQASSDPGAAVESLEALLPGTRSYFTYSGSLTTPPCTEGVRWIVLETPVALSEQQIGVFAEAHGVTNRPVQALNERVVRYTE